ncbi:MAG: helix-turn-helix domain-containing protein [Clostridia bacterium]|nr:helix-turn-helix domain-containing protein [Clostridia bacterium]
MDVKNYNFYVVFSWMTTVLKLSGNELAVFAIIYSFSQDGKSEFNGSLNYLRKFTNTSKQTVITLLDKLQARNYICKRQYYDGAIPRNAYRANLDLLKKLDEDFMKDQSEINAEYSGQKRVVKKFD